MATIKDGKGTLALAAFDTKAQLAKHEFGRPEPGPNDVSIAIQYCGHEIAGVVQSAGENVTKFKVGDKVGVGCFVDSCGSCEQCQAGLQNYCAASQSTYGSMYTAGLGHDDCADCHTNGGYSSQITVKAEFVYSAPDGLELEYLGPLLCAGITMFSPLNKHVLKKGGNKKVAIVGFGGLGHIGVKIAKAMDCEVTVLSRNTSKKDQAAAVGAELLAHTDEVAMKEAENKFDVIIDTVAVAHDVTPLLATLKVGGTYHCIGGVPQPISISPFGLILKNIKIEGSLVGGVPETQEMLDFCNKHNIKPDIKIIHAKDASTQFTAMASGASDATRAVIDMSTLADVE